MTQIAGAAAAVALLLCSVTESTGATPADLELLAGSPDVAVDLGGTAIRPSEVAEDDLLGTVQRVAPAAGLDEAADLGAFAVMANGDFLLAFDSSFSLPDETVVLRGDVVRVGPLDAEVVFSARDAGVPAGAMVDAVALFGDDLVLSFDVSVDVKGVVADDEDLVLFDGEITSLVFDGSLAGVPSAVDLDAAHFDEARGLLLLSFDTGGEIDGVAFDDDDVLGFQFNDDSWQLVYDGSAAFAAWSAADLDALSAVFVEPTPGPVTPTATATGTPTLSPTPVSSATPSVTPSATVTLTATPLPATRTPLATNSPSTSRTPDRRGDLDGDGRVDRTDLATLIAAIFSQSPPAAADVNLDATVSAGDLPALLRLLERNE